MDITSERNVQGMDITSGQGPDYCLQDGDHTDGHYITLFAEQLTRTFEVLVSHYFDLVHYYLENSVK